jgi:hypothetical protein
MSATTKWIALALLGLAIAVGVAFAASRLVSEQIGIASESVSAGYELAPAVRSATAPAGDGARGDGATVPDDNPSGSAPSEQSTPGPAPTGGNEGAGADERDQGADEIEDLEKQREDELEDRLKEQEDREDEIRDLEEDRRDD